MKKYYFIISILGILLLASCSSDKKKPRMERILEFQSTLTAEDTTTMLKLCDDAMEQLKAKEYDKVLAYMYEYTDSTQEVKPLTEATRKRYLRMFRMFPVLDYVRKYYSFQLEGCNDVRYQVTFATAEQAGTADDPKTAYMFNPVKVDGSWKLCVKTAQDALDEFKR